MAHRNFVVRHFYVNVLNFFAEFETFIYILYHLLQ